MSETDDHVQALINFLVEPPIEAQGILGRIERHLAHIRDQHLITTGEQDRVLADVKAHVAWLHAFVPDRLAKVHAEVMAELGTVKATLGTILEAQQVYNETLAGIGAQLGAIDARLYALESRDRSISNLIDRMRRLDAMVRLARFTGDTDAPDADARS